MTFGKKRNRRTRGVPLQMFASKTARGVTVSHHICMCDIKYPPRRSRPPWLGSRSSLLRSAFHMLLTKDNMLPQITLKPELPAAHVALVYDELGVCCWLNHVLFNLLTKGIVWHGSLADAIAPPLRTPRSVRHPASKPLLLPLLLGATCCLHWPLKQHGWLLQTADATAKPCS